MAPSFPLGTALALACIVLTGLVAYLLVHRLIFIPIKNIEATIQLWMEDYHEPIAVSRNRFGITELESSFNQLLLHFHRTLDEFKSIIEHSGTGMLVVDANGTILFANFPAAHLLNRRAETLEGSQLGLPAVAGSNTEIEIPRGNGEQHIVELRSSKIEWYGTAAHLLAIHDVTERHQAEESSRHQSLHDTLTGLPNRAFFHDRLNKAIQRAETLNQGLSLLFLDLDRFKEINDTLGHAAGDEFLKAIAERINGVMRSDDLVARMSGDEFTILLEGLNDREIVSKVAKKIHAAISAPLNVAAQTLTPKCTIGFSLYPEDASDASTLLMYADTAMYHAKTDGRNRTQAFDTNQGRKASSRFWMEQALKDAESNGEFRLFYQPQVTLPSGEPTDVEALLRWEHPQKGLISPGDFIPMLEETDQIQSVGNWIFHQAAADLEHWHEIGLSPHRIWINMSARQLSSPDLVDRIDEIIADTGLNPERFGIELTESGIASNIEHSISVVDTLQKRGFHIAMDDFGKGYSALTFLRRLPLDTLKIDRAFVQDLDENPTTALKLVRAILSMGQALQIQVLAEGVEKASQADHLSAEGCRYAQGFWFARPMPPDKLAEWWRAFSQY